jgi:hypothetical protein
MVCMSVRCCSTAGSGSLAEECFDALQPGTEPLCMSEDAIQILWLGGSRSYGLKQLTY